MKVQAIWLSAIGSMMNDLLQYDYDTKIHGIKVFTNDSCKSMLKFVEKFNEASNKLASDIEILKKESTNIDEEVKKSKELLIAGFDSIESEEEKRKEYQNIQNEFLKIDEEGKKAKSELTEKLKEINTREYELPEVSIVTEGPFDSFPAKLMWAVEFFSKK